MPESNLFEKVKIFSKDYVSKNIKYNIYIHLLFIIIGLISFSYFVQSPNCFHYDDIRRNIIGFISGFLIIGTFIYSIPYYIKSSSQDDSSTDDIKYEILKSLLLILTQIILLSLIFIPIVILTSSDLKESNPNLFGILKGWSIFSSIILMLGGTIPFSESIIKNLIRENQRITISYEN